MVVGFRHIHALLATVLAAKVNVAGCHGGPIYVSRPSNS